MQTKTTTVFVTLEGIEGSGKSTLLAGLAGWLRDGGREVVTTREPGGTPLGDAIRALFLDRSLKIDPVTEAMLVNAARAQHVASVIRPALASGLVVLCDRFVDSTIAYQGFGRGLDVAELSELCRVATGGLVPDVTFVLDVPLQVSRARTRARHPDADRMEAEDDAFHERVRAGFLTIAAGSRRHAVLDGTLDVAALMHAAADVIARRFGARDQA